MRTPPGRPGRGGRRKQGRRRRGGRGRGVRGGGALDGDQLERVGEVGDMIRSVTSSPWVPWTAVRQVSSQPRSSRGRARDSSATPRSAGSRPGRHRERARPPHATAAASRGGAPPRTPPPSRARRPTVADGDVHAAGVLRVDVQRVAAEGATRRRCLHGRTTRASDHAATSTDISVRIAPTVTRLGQRRKGSG